MIIRFLAMIVNYGFWLVLLALVWWLLLIASIAIDAKLQIKSVNVVMLKWSFLSLTITSSILLLTRLIFLRPLLTIILGSLLLLGILASLSLLALANFNVNVSTTVTKIGWKRLNKLKK